MAQNGLDKRRMILDAAVTVFARQGFHHCRVSDVADEAGVAYGLVYHYFDSKEEILNRLFTERWQLMLDAIVEIDARRDVTAREKLAARHFEHEDAHEVRIAPPGAEQDLGNLAQLLARGVAGSLDVLDRRDQGTPGLAKDVAQHLFLRREVVVEQAVGDPGLLGDVTDPCSVVALPREDPHRRVEKQPALVFLRLCLVRQS